jgi:predicted porin
MQKKLIAVAVAGLMSGAAFAQSNVTVYGVADLFYAHVSATGAPSANAIDSGGLAGSRLGFKGVEDLGNGIKALFVLEYGLALDTNSGLGDWSARTAPVNSWNSTGYNTNSVGTNNTARQQLVGLTGAFGTVAGGYAQTAGYDFACAVDPLAGGALDTTSRLPGQMLLNCGKGGRSSNAIAYISPSFSGFNFALNYALGENMTATTSADNAFLVAANFATGPVDVRAVYSKAKINSNNVVTSGNVYNVTNVNASNSFTTNSLGVVTATPGNAGGTQNVPLPSGTTIKEFGLGGSYDLGVAKLFASYQTLNANILTGTNKTYQFGVAVPLAGGALVGSYAKVKLDEIDKLTGLKFDDKSYAIAYVYGLSKRTKVYGGYNKYDNDKNSSRIATGLTPTAGGSTNTYGVGVNHSF